MSSPGKTKIKLAEALLRRKELQAKVAQIAQFKTSQLYTDVVERIRVDQGWDDLKAKFAKLDLGQVTEEYDFYAKHLRLIDALIQQANWSCELEVDPASMMAYSESKK